MLEMPLTDNQNNSVSSLNEEEACIICTTPFQVMGAISIVKNEGLKKADLYICSTFNGYDGIAERLNQLQLFRKVLIIDYEKLRLETDLTSKRYLTFKKALMLLYYIKNLLFLKSTVRKYLNPEAVYNRVYVSTNNFAGRLVILSYIKRKLPFQVFHYDDGIGSYYATSEIDGIKPYDKLLRTIFVGKRSVNVPFIKLLFSPSFYSSICEKANTSFPQNMTKIVKMEPLRKSESSDLIIRNVYGLTTDYLISQTYIYFDTIKAEEFNNKGIGYIQQVASLIQSCVGKDNLIYKFHPRDKNIDLSLPHIENTSVPFECFCYYNDFSNKVLITNFSTSVFTPKVFYEQEPTVIFLYRIMADYQIMNIDTTSVEALRSIYTDKSKIIVPENVEELKIALKRLSGR